jgi:hypothetical protein
MSSGKHINKSTIFLDEIDIVPKFKNIQMNRNLSDKDIFYLRIFHTKEIYMFNQYLKDKILYKKTKDSKYLNTTYDEYSKYFSKDILDYFKIKEEEIN